MEHGKKIATSALLGDELIQSPRKIITHSIKISAPSEKVWPWLVQLGSGRAGWYSYDRIDNGGKPSAKQIIPELQNIKVGDIMPAVPDSKDAFIIQEVKPSKAIVLVVPIQTSTEVPNPLQRTTGHLRVSWLLMLESLDKGKTRLISRGRISNDWLTQSKVSTFPRRQIFIERVYSLLAKMPWFILLPFALIGHSIMESRMLRGIKQRVELESKIN
ncbi:MAG TPA: hypothetical protein VIV35_08730 [Chitinophagaceae bacterium]